MKSLRIKDRLQRGKAAISAPKNDRVQRMVDITAKKAKGKGKGYEKWATLHNLKQMAATISIYEESGFSSPEELEAALTAANAELSNVHAELKAVESTLREKKDLQKQLLAYIKTKPARDGLKAQKTEKARKNYREQRKIEFIIAEAATRFLKAMSVSRMCRILHMKYLPRLNIQIIRTITNRKDHPQAEDQRRTECADN